MGIFESIGAHGLGETARKIHETVMWDFADAVPSTHPPLKVEAPLPSNVSQLPIVESIFNPLNDSEGFQMRLWEKAKALPPGSYATRDYAGHAEEGTAHSHYFVIDRTDTGATLMFVDPEHYLNRSPRRGKILRTGDIRPQVCNLMAVRFHEGQVTPDIAITRFRTAKLVDPVQVTFDTQLGEARNLFENQGIPKVIIDHQEEIILRLVVEPSANKPMILQSRYTDRPEDLQKFLTTGRGFSFLRGKARSSWGIMGEFSAHLARNEFKLRPKDKVS